MADSQKTKEQLIEGLGEMRQQVVKLERVAIENKRMEEELNRYREQLRELVEERTAELKAANERLQQEIAERKQAEEAVIEEKERKYLDVAGVMLVAIDVNQRVTLINKKGCEILGCREEEIIGKNWFDNFVPERMRQEIETVFAKAIGGEIELVEYSENPVLTKPHGETFISWHNAILTDETGNITGILCSGEDITERQLLSKKMLEYEELDKMKTNLLSSVSHELRTPLAILKGYTTMLLDYDRKLKHKEKTKYLESIDKATDRLTELVAHLLDLSQLEAGLLKLDKRATNMSKLIEETVIEARLRVPKHKIVAELKEKLPKVKVDARRIRQVLDNLVDNAVKYSRGDTEVVIEARRERGELIISITDQGRGIPTPDLERVFDRMYRVEQRLAPDIGGVGLGLAICKGLVEAHGGHIWVDSKPGEGSTFYFTLPCES